MQINNKMQLLYLRLECWPISVNSMYRVYNGRSILSAKGRSFRAYGLEQIALCRPQWEKLPLDGRLAMTIRLSPPDKRIRDIDNHLKATLDLLTHAAVIQDDSLIDDLRVIRQDIYPGGLVEISVYDCKKEGEQGCENQSPKEESPSQKESADIKG